MPSCRRLRFLVALRQGLVVFLVLLLLSLGMAQECTVGPDGTEVCSEQVDTSSATTTCTDALGATKCASLAARNGCIESFATMRHQCAETCLLCHNTLDLVALEEEYSKGDRYELQRLYSQEFPQVIEGDQRVDTYRYLLDMDEYMYETVYHDDEYAAVRTQCQNRHELCTFWALLGECEKNPAYMKMQCAPSCFTCDELDFDKRCPFDRDAPAHFQPGGLDAMFERIMSEPALAQYSPQALMRPNPPADSDAVKGPWIVVLEDFLSPQECETLIRLGGEKGYEQSMDVGERKFDGTYDAATSKDRTSSNAWCIEECWEHEVTKTVHDRLELLTGIDRMNYEYLQLLRYEEGQFYGEHHDFIEHHTDRAQGPRTLTVFLYLNDVEAGGGTHFSRLNQTVIPKRGRAVIWPSVRNEDPMKKDPRTMHEALPVEAGIKYGANAWIHQRDFKTPWLEGCH